ncbi:hypothetical protein VII00023_08547 [Vibrio ichthyoenteri ATCC 700023]|uniref:Uncharacterized protein n=1 Tax=Vibrio ichthyoenteri ATCC 700023 TaxID=870968 RepID=F9S5Z6_9VIBR|nr:hypothetical protein VII00023_08547 [Vibrio ichthyoenteri ATCC 700023]
MVDLDGYCLEQRKGLPAHQQQIVYMCDGGGVWLETFVGEGGKVQQDLSKYHGRQHE